MKLRIQANSIRFRITPTELHALATRGRVESAIQLGPAADDRLSYALEVSRECSAVRLEYRPGKVCAVLPEESVREWASTEQVAIGGLQQVANGGELKILIEKDFKCLQTRPGENEGDRFPHPTATGNA
jgi:hypothetical protein